MQVSNPDRVVFPERGFTKGDVVRHYQTVGPRMIDYLAGRPLTLERYPRGLDGQGFMQKNAGAHFPDSIRRYEVPKREGGVTTYPVVDRAEDLAYLANQGTVTFHMWTATMHRPDHPDWLVIDLDPSPGDLDGVRAATHATRNLLAEFGLTGFPLATGSSGFHVWVPVDGRGDATALTLVARSLAGLGAVRHPDLLTTEFLKRNRKNRVFVDWMRNGTGSTVVAPFSLRARPSAPVAVPVRWEEVDRVAPDQWTLGDLGDRLELETEVDRQAVPLDRIEAAAREAGVDLDMPFDRFGRER